MEEQEIEEIKEEKSLPDNVQKIAEFFIKHKRVATIFSVIILLFGSKMSEFLNKKGW